MSDVEAVNLFLRHAADHDLPDAELYRLKAEAFEAMAVTFDRDGERAAADECRSTATAARQRANGTAS